VKIRTEAEIQLPGEWALGFLVPNFANAEVVVGTEKFGNRWRRVSGAIHLAWPTASSALSGVDEGMIIGNGCPTAPTFP